MTFMKVKKTIAMWFKWIGWYTTWDKPVCLEAVEQNLLDPDEQNS